MTGHGVRLTDDGRGAVLTLAWATPPITANGQRGSHHAHARHVREVRALAAGLARAARTPDRRQLRLQRADIALVWYPTIARRRDAPNLYPLLKPLVDGLVTAGLLPDDNDDVVTVAAPRIVLQSAGPARFELTITERTTP